MFAVAAISIVGIMLFIMFFIAFAGLMIYWGMDDQEPILVLFGIAVVGWIILGFAGALAYVVG